MLIKATVISFMCITMSSLLLGKYVSAGTASQVIAFTDQAAYSNAESELPGSVAQLAQPAKPTEIVSSKDYLRVSDVVRWHLARLLRSDVLPDRSLVDDNLVLSHGKSVGENFGRRDVASLKVRFGQLEAMISQTGGPDGKTTFIFVRSKSNLVTNVGDAQAVLYGVLQELFQWAPSSSSDFNAVKDGNAYKLTLKKSAKPESVFATMVSLVSEHYTCITFNQYGPKDTVPAREPDSNEWFAWERQKARSKPD